MPDLHYVGDLEKKLIAGPEENEVTPLNELRINLIAMPEQNERILPVLKPRKKSRLFLSAKQKILMWFGHALKPRVTSAERFNTTIDWCTV